MRKGFSRQIDRCAWTGHGGGGDRAASTLAAIIFNRLMIPPQTDSNKARNTRPRLAQPSTAAVGTAFSGIAPRQRPC
jgi:hypothetical protein